MNSAGREVSVMTPSLPVLTAGSCQPLESWLSLLYSRGSPGRGGLGCEGYMTSSVPVKGHQSHLVCGNHLVSGS